MNLWPNHSDKSAAPKHANSRSSQDIRRFALTWDNPHTKFLTPMRSASSEGELLEFVEYEIQFRNSKINCPYASVEALLIAWLPHMRHEIVIGARVVKFSSPQLNECTKFKIIAVYIVIFRVMLVHPQATAIEKLARSTTQHTVGKIEVM
ncbi:hypothetical protein GLOTRDRAFT_90611 [Gloeophyllum trabeum ATCC 11539]|uniref:Uncharacterized protein n=1 Tax=Gloeophyllum trabeum (strain ATCC 11539 / FP-39264 / Madison 617) TaxID=670483 RepID=S7QG22_GLOTA|nr:uncharacterized protein GLOTRDRAFT_90611 [Gloeophyllum trabeum ATCC 11539]EPQ58831.1 hypothetical protein GLOTRDRAFT_90611 [Gloeophyllum trabeum ATCC 11539]